MSERKDQTEQSDRDDETMARLMRLAGPRDPVPGDVETRVYNVVAAAWKQAAADTRSERVYENVQREWVQNSWRDRIRQWMIPLALAATGVLVVAVVMRPPMPTSMATPAGTVDRVVDQDGGADLPDPGDDVYAGDRLVTGPGDGISLRLANAESLRLDENSVIDILAADRFRLVRGRLYADTGDLMYRQRRLVVDTSLGVVTDIGTQFAVSTGDDRLEVAVREGRVDVSQDTAVRVAVAGELMRLSPDGEFSTQVLATHDDYWNWASALAPMFDIENKSLLDFLRWAARESGRELEFEDQELRMSAMRTDLHGSVAGFEPLEAIESVLATTALRYRIEADKIIIYR
jgi:ferric-dicitrate binding protein FerR (iron transport regulator)